VAEEVITRTLPDGTQRPITVLRLSDGLTWKHADSDTLLVRHFYDPLFTHVLHRLQPRSVQRGRHYVITGNPGAFSCEGEGGALSAGNIGPQRCRNRHMGAVSRVWQVSRGVYRRH